MEFTKKELRLLDPKHEKQMPFLLWTGICFLIAAVILIPLGYQKSQSTKKIFQKNIAFAGSIKIDSSKTQRNLKEGLVESEKDLQEAVNKALFEATEKIV